MPARWPGLGGEVFVIRVGCDGYCAHTFLSLSVLWVWRPISYHKVRSLGVAFPGANARGDWGSETPGWTLPCRGAWDHFWYLA